MIFLNTLNRAASSGRQVCRGRSHPKTSHTAPGAVQEYPLEIEAVAQLIRQGIPGAEVQVSGDGSHFDAVVVSEAFEGLTPIKKQRLVMDTVKSQIASGELHALSIKTLTPAQSAEQSG
jgi:acid stress-induced BolA-like protein IbaG/YrbA